MTKLHRIPLLAALAFSFASLSSAAFADAPGDAWDAAKKMLPGNAVWVGGMNVATIRGSTIFQQLYPKLLANAGEGKEGLEMVKTECKIDVMDAIQGLVVAADDANQVVLVISTKGLDKSKINDCAQKVAKKEKKDLTVGAADGQGIVEYSVKGENDHAFIAYLPKGVMVIAPEGKDKAGLQKWLAGKGAAGQLASGIGKVNTGAALWGVFGKAQELEPGMNMKVGYGQADLAAGNISCEIHLALGSAKEATDAVAKANKQLEDAKKGGNIPPALAGVVKSVKIQAVGDEFQVKAQMAEKEALSIIGMAMGGGGQ
jgi:hypothetical protein